MDDLSENDNLQPQVGEEANGNDSDDNEAYHDISDGGWIQWFCQQEGYEFFVEIDEEFVRNRTNLYGITQKMKNYRKLIETILSPEPPSEEVMTEEYMEGLQEAKELYGLLHARFIITNKGLALIREKYLNGVYGHCPRILCDKQILLPIGLSEDLKYSRVKVYCPKCEEIYKPRQKCTEIDGGYFGCSFPHVFLLAYPDLNPALKPCKQYIPRIYGFKIYGKVGSKYYSKNKNNEQLKKLGNNKLNDDISTFSNTIATMTLR